MHDVSNIWRVPLLMQSQDAHKTILRVLGLGGHADKLDMHGWKTQIADRYGACLLLLLVLLLLCQL
jgi:CTP synthase